MTPVYISNPGCHLFSGVSMTPVYISNRVIIPVYVGDEEVYEALHVLARIEGEVAKGATAWLEST